MPNAKVPGVGLVTANDYRKILDETMEAAEKCPAGCNVDCVDCADCGSCKADLALERVEDQTSLVMRLGVRVQALLGTLASES